MSNLADTNPYEVHIVGYNKTQFQDLPEGYEPLEVTQTDVCLSAITTFEMQDIETATQAFYAATEWRKKQPQDMELHIKLELLRGIERLPHADMGDLTTFSYPTLPEGLSYAKNYFVGAFGWDIHIDGLFDPALRQHLKDKGWITLGYISSYEAAERITLTQHFLDEKDCRAVYEGMLEYLKAIGGFEGTIYWEEPLQYLVSTTKP